MDTSIQALLSRVLDEIRGSLRFRWPALATAWVICIVGWIYVMSLPNVFEAHARVYVDTQTALRPLLKGLAVDPNVESDLMIVRQALLSRPQLVNVARNTGFDLRARTPEEKEALITYLQQNITIRNDMRARRAQAEGLYQIAFRDRDRQMSLNVVQTLLHALVEDTLGNNRTGQQTAARFLNEQIADYERRLTEAENRLAEFKRRNVGTMPDSRGDYFARLQEAIAQASQVSTALKLAEARKAELQRQLTGEDPYVFGFDSNPASADAGVSPDLTSRIQELEAREQELLLRFTEKHPEVIAVRSTLAELRKRMDEELARVKRGQQATGALASSLQANPLYQSIEVDLKRTEVQIAEMRQDLAQRNARVAELRRLVDTVPAVEAELARLNRDYEVTRAQYTALVQRRETAKITNDADQTGTVKFEIIDPPTVGIQPVAPDRTLLLGGVLVAALGAAAGVAFLLNKLRPVFLSARSLADATGLPVLGSVSRTWMDRYKASMRPDRIAFSAAAALLLVVFAAVMVWRDAGARLLGQ